jgi:hypothetical protein
VIYVILCWLVCNLILFWRYRKRLQRLEIVAREHMQQAILAESERVLYGYTRVIRESVCTAGLYYVADINSPLSFIQASQFRNET